MIAIFETSDKLLHELHVKQESVDSHDQQCTDLNVRDKLLLRHSMSVTPFRKNGKRVGQYSSHFRLNKMGNVHVM
jgi:hypothetical protein